MSGHVANVISESCMMENVGVAAEIASPSLFVQKLFHFRFVSSTFCVADDGRCRAMSPVADLSPALSKTVGVAAEIASPSISVHKLFPLPVFTSGFVADT